MHQIRLRRPWNRSTAAGEPSVRSDVPDASPAETDQVTYERAFHCPTGLSPEQRVDLVIESFVGTLGSLMLNEASLLDSAPTANPPLRLEITPLLRPSNQLSIKLLKSRQDFPSLNGSVHLEISAD